MFFPRTKSVESVETKVVQVRLLNKRQPGGTKTPWESKGTSQATLPRNKVPLLKGLFTTIDLPGQMVKLAFFWEYIFSRENKVQTLRVHWLSEHMMLFLLFWGGRVGGLESAHVYFCFLIFGEHIVSLPNMMDVHIMFHLNFWGLQPTYLVGIIQV